MSRVLLCTVSTQTGYDGPRWWNAFNSSPITSGIVTRSISSNKNTFGDLHTQYVYLVIWSGDDVRGTWYTYLLCSPFEDKVEFCRLDWLPSELVRFPSLEPDAATNAPNTNTTHNNYTHTHVVCMHRATHTYTHTNNSIHTMYMK